MNTIGCSFDGLKDRYFVAGEDRPRGTNFYLADAVLPVRFGGKILVGDEAEFGRISSGMHWPPESRILGQKFIRRLPLAWAWRLLIDFGDKSPKWLTSKQASFSLEKVIAAHIASQISPALSKESQVVITIPNDLDEFAQENLINELIWHGIGQRNDKPKLVWRPVAAALCWLDKVQSEMSGKIAADDFLLVIHIGPDCIEVVPFELREKTSSNKAFVIPLRKSAKDKINLSGCDWAAGIIENVLSIKSLSVFWQVFTGFPEIWQLLSRGTFDTGNLPRVINAENDWGYWNPSNDISNDVWDIEIKASENLKLLSSESIRFGRPSTDGGITWRDLLRNVVRSAIGRESGKLKGVILSGPLASINPSPWMNDLRGAFEEKGLNFEISKSPKVGCIWSPAIEEDPVSEGAAIYGARLMNKEPTYLDTLPQLSLLVINYKRERQWRKLLDNDEFEIRGGDSFKKPLMGIFNLARGKKHLEVILRKGENPPYKKADVYFPYAPDSDVNLDTWISMASAGGLAQIEFIPDDADLLGKPSIFMDYSLMTEMNDLPPVKLGYPLLKEDLRDPEDSRIRDASFQAVCKKFLTLDPREENYYALICDMGHYIRSGVARINDLGERYYCQIVDRNGLASTDEGKEIINEISQKLGKDFEFMKSAEIQDHHVRRIAKVKKIFLAATWLFGNAPREAMEFLRGKFENFPEGIGHIREHLLVPAAGRCFSEREDMAIFFESGIRRANAWDVGWRGFNSKRAFPVYWSQAIWRVLSHRDEAPFSMSKQQADIFMRYSFLNMKAHADNNNYQRVFLQSVRTMVYLLRYRIADEKFMSAESEGDETIFSQIIKCLKNAEAFYLSRRRFSHRAAKAAELMKEIQKYMYYEGGGDLPFEKVLDNREESEEAEE